MSATVTLTGRLASDPELRFTQSGTAMCKFTVVTSGRRYNRESQQWEDVDTTFWRCTAWRDLAENITEQELTKGQAVIVSGNARQNDWTDRDGNNRSTIEVNVNSMGPDLRWRSKTSQRSKAADAPADDPWAASPGQPADDEPPF